jgi:hypothetical protein
MKAEIVALLKVIWRFGKVSIQQLLLIASTLHFTFCYYTPGQRLSV